MVNFIVLIKSYILNKGIISIIDEMDRGKVLAEFHSFDQITNPAILNESHFIITDSLDELPMDLSINNPGVNIIVISDNKQNNPYFININWDKEETESFFINLRQDFEEESTSDKSASELSDREIDVLKCVALGMTNKEIAEHLFISSHTVITHRKNITRKLGIKTVSGLTVYAYLNKYISLDDVNK